ncbi:MAG: DUF2752 domain-containing protein [Planctomycetota bacterium]|jgi:hypothetical protein
MTTDQQTNSVKKQKLSVRARIVGAGIFCLITAGFAVLWLSANDYIRLEFWLGICGFKQRYHLPCPGCGWTHAAQAFVTGHPIMAFQTQPAAAFFCIIAVLTALFALHSALFGLNSGFLQRILSSIGLSVLAIVAVVVILAGWGVTLARTILESSGP